jgi:hypothetical protein
MNPPTMTLAPVGIIATASSTETALMMKLQSINERAEVTGMMTRAINTPLICVKAFRYYAWEVVMSTPSSVSAHSLPISA